MYQSMTKLSEQLNTLFFTLKLPESWVRCPCGHYKARKIFNFIPWFDEYTKCKGLLQLQREDSKCECKKNCQVRFSRLILRCQKCNSCMFEQGIRSNLKLDLIKLNSEIKKEWGEFVKGEK